LFIDSLVVVIAKKKKGKVVPVLNYYYVTKHSAMKAYGGVDVYTHVFLISALVGGAWSASPLRKEAQVPIG
jgi:hypothetical protein